MTDKKSIPPGPPMTRASSPISQNTRKTQANIRSSLNVRVVQESFNPVNPVNPRNSKKVIADSTNNDKNKK